LRGERKFTDGYQRDEDVSRWKEKKEGRRGNVKESKGRTPFN